MTNNQPKRNSKSQYETLYSTWMAFYLHQDRLMWSRVHFLIAIHTAVFAGIFLQRDNWLGPAIALFAAFMTLLISIIMLVDLGVRDLNVPLIKEIEGKLLSQKIKKKFPDAFQLSGRLPSWATHAIIESTLMAFFVIDVIIAFLFWVAPHLFFFPGPS